MRKLNDQMSVIHEQLIKIGNLKETILNTREADRQHRKELDERIAQLEKEITEGKAKLEKLNSL